MTGRHPFRSISAVLIRRTIGLAVLAMAVVLGMQAWLLQRQQDERLATVLGEIAASSVPLLALGLWDIEPEAVQKQVQLIAGRPEIGYARLVAVGGQRFVAGDPQFTDRPADHRLVIHAPKGQLNLGELELVSHPGFYWRSLGHATLRVIVGHGLVTVLICLMIAVLLRRVLQRPLEEMARFAGELTPQRLMTPLRLNRPRQKHLDEIDVLAEGFAKLQAGLKDHIAHLDEQVAERTRQLEALLAEIRELSVTDALTGAFNRRSLNERLPVEFERARRYGHALAVMFIDLDHFKQINDNRGHAVGDEVLRQAAAFIRANLRQNVDWLARYGGEEFLLVLPEADLAAASVTAQRLRQGLQRLKIACADGTSVSVTASFGVSVRRPDESSDELLARVDKLLYRAKAEGRDRVVAEA